MGDYRSNHLGSWDRKKVYGHSGTYAQNSVALVHLIPSFCKDIDVI